jgi:hypothetical protein
VFRTPAAIAILEEVAFRRIREQSAPKTQIDNAVYAVTIWLLVATHEHARDALVVRLVQEFEAATSRLSPGGPVVNNLEGLTTTREFVKGFTQEYFDTLQ